jgi:hypothetical protein
LAVNLAVVALVKPSKSDRADDKPRLVFERCLIRGHGDLLLGQPARPCDIKVDNVLTALSGSFLRLASAGDGGAVPIELQMNRVTTYLEGHLLHVTADKETQSLLPMVIKPTNCLFISADGKVLVHLDGGNVSGDRIRDLLTWDGMHNAYNRFEHMLEQMPVEKMEMKQTLYNRDRWKQFARDEGEFEKSLLVTPPSRDELTRDEFPRVSAARFKVKASSDQPYGHDQDQLPRTARDDK